MTQTQPNNEAVPALDVIVDAEAETVCCPHCGAEDIREEDRCVRWNPGDFIFENGKVAAACWSQQDSDFETIGFLCGTCQGPVNLPSDVSHTW